MHTPDMAAQRSVNNSLCTCADACTHTQTVSCTDCREGREAWSTCIQDASCHDGTHPGHDFLMLVPDLAVYQLPEAAHLCPTHVGADLHHTWTCATISCHAALWQRRLAAACSGACATAHMLATAERLMLEEVHTRYLQRTLCDNLSFLWRHQVRLG